MIPRDWLLLLLALRDAEQALDPVRIQKGLFLLAQEAELAPGESYEFMPYDYGPFSSEIYGDLQDLVEGGLVEELEVPGYNWHQYRVTAEGIDRARQLAEQLNSGQRASLRQLAEVKRDVLSLGFDALLRYVYGRHPDFAVRSVFR